MKTKSLNSKLLLITTVLITCNLLANAKIWRVNGNAGADGDFATISGAITAAFAGDTIIIEPLLNYNVYSELLNINKPLKIFGSGYYLDSNDSTQHYSASSKVSNFSFNAGSSGSEISGIVFYNSGSTISSGVAFIKINRCLFVTGTIFSDILTINSNSISITQCYFDVSSGAYHAINIGSQNNTIANNIFQTANNIKMTPTSSSIFLNNIFIGGNIFHNSSFSNNIFKSATPFAGTTNNTFSNNLFAIDTVVAWPNNFFNIDMNTVFTGGSHPELKHTLKTGSPAIGAATDGGDCGPFGGLAPYILSGMPPIPAIFDFNIDAISNPSNNTLGVRVKAKTHN